MPRVVKRTVVLAVLWAAALGVLMLPACTAFEPVAEHVARAIDRYCAEPYSARLLLRESVNAQLAGHRVRVECAGDPEAPPSAQSAAPPLVPDQV